jgi:predicted MFS family arabinose efflux permease
MGLFGGILLGQLVGGLLARAWGVTGPFWFGFVGSAVILGLIWRQLTHITHAGEEALPAGVL